MFLRVLLTAMALITASAANPPSTLTGHWAGTLHRGTAHLSVSFDFPPGAEGKGFFSAPKLSAIDVPLSNVRSGSAPHWDIVGDTYATEFDGLQSGDSIRGTFSEPPGNGTFVLRRVSTSTAKPYMQQPVTFVNGDARLSGTVFAPVGAGKHPAIVFLHGSGPEGRWANAYLADYMARHGVVALVYDKRGVGASTADWRTATMQDLANDG